MRWVRGGPLPTILAVIGAFVIGLSSNRVYYNDASREGGMKVGGGDVLVRKGEREMIRDAKMEDIVDVFGQSFFDKSVSYSGTNHRLRRILRRALAGEPIKVAVLGGSITAGHNMPDETSDVYTFHRLFFDWFEETFPDATHSYFPVGLGAFGSSYFANCFLEHIPADIDLVIVDLAVNDLRDDDFHRSYDHLLRALLTLPSAPAIATMEFFTTTGWLPQTNAGSNQLDTSRFLDIPSLSLRNPLLPELLLHPSRVPDFFGRLPHPDGVVDPRHPDLRGHLAAANILKYHFWQQILFVEAHNTEKDVALERLAVPRIGVVDEEAEGVYVPSRPRTKKEHEHWNSDRSFLTETSWGSKNEELEIVPRLALLDAFDPSKFVPASLPRCKSISGTREKLTILSTTKGNRIDEKGVTHHGGGDGWYEWQSSPKKQYIMSHSPKAEVTFAITVGLGDVKLWYLRSSELNLGIVRCWVDNDQSKWTRLDGSWDLPMSIGAIGSIREGLAPGDHNLTCMLEGTEFRISSLITG